MFGKFGPVRRAALAAVLAVAGLASATTAQARDRYRDGGGDDAVIAIGAGIVGLAIGAALADRDDRYYNNRGWHSNRRYVRVRGYDDYYYYYQNNPRRYYRDRHFNRNYRNWYGRQGYDSRDRRRDRWERRHDRNERGYQERSWNDGERYDRRNRYRGGEYYNGYRGDN